MGSEKTERKKFLAKFPFIRIFGIWNINHKREEVEVSKKFQCVWTGGEGERERENVVSIWDFSREEFNFLKWNYRPAYLMLICTWYRDFLLDDHEYTM